MDKDLQKAIATRRDIVVKSVQVPGVEGFFGQVVSGNDVLATTDTPFVDADDAISHTQQILAECRNNLPADVDLTEKVVKRDYVQNDRVRYEAGVFTGTGSVCGRIDYDGGVDWVVALDHRLDGYDFSHVVMRSEFLQPLS